MKYLKLFTNFLQTLGELQDDEVGRLFRAMLKYAEDGSEPVFHGNERYVWGAATLHMDMAKRYSEKQAELGRSGGQANRSEPKRTEANPSEPKPKEKKRKEYKEILSNESTKKFVPPTLEEIVSYIREQRYSVDAEKFLNYYTANGWLIGKSHMKDWRAAVRSWQSREPKRQTAYRNADLERLEVQL